MPGNREVAVGGGADRLSDLPDGILELVLSFLPAADAVRTSVLSRRFRGAWAHAPALNFSDHLLRDLFLGFAREALARYGAPDIPALHVTIGSEFNLGPATDAWLRDAMERAVESVSVTVTAPGALHCLTLPRCLRAMSIALRLSGVCFQHCPLVLPEPGAPTSFCGLTELSLSRVRLQERVRPLGVFLSSCCTQLRKLRLSKQTNMYATPPNNSFDPGRNSFMPLAAEPSYGPFPGSYSEQRVQRPSGYGFQPQTSNERLSVGTRGSYQGGSSNHHAGNAMDDPAAVAAEFQRHWVPPQPPGVIMPEAAAAIRQARLVPRQQPGDGHLSTDVPRPLESAMATTEHVNGAPEAPGGELPSHDGGTMTANASSGGGSEEQQQEAA